MLGVVKLFKIKDRFLLGVVAGLAGNTIKMAIDEISIKKRYPSAPSAKLRPVSGYQTGRKPLI